MDDQDHEHDHSSQQNPHAPTGCPQETPPRADVDEILRRKRKAREYKVSLRAQYGHHGQTGRCERLKLLDCRLGYRNRCIEAWRLRTAPTHEFALMAPRPAIRADNARSNAISQCRARHASSGSIPSYVPTTRRASRIPPRSA